MENSQILFEMLKKVDEKLDSHTETLARLEVMVEKNAEDIKYHIARTDLLEERIDIDKKYIESRLDILEEPSLVAKFLSNNIVKYCGLTAAVFGFIQILKQIKSWF